jgi:hypothetical protein
VGRVLDEIEAVLHNSLEQNELAHLATTQGRWDADPQKTAEFFADMLAGQATCIRKLAAYVDELRAAADGR